jgi:hypothetical protein
MLEPKVTIRDLRDPTTIRDDLAYWLSRPPEERMAVVDQLWRLRHGPVRRLQRVARIVDLPRREDLADREDVDEKTDA